MKLRDGVDPPNHEYMVRCERLGCKRNRYPDAFGKRPLAAMQSARKHAMRVRGHVVYVMDMTSMEAAHRYETVTQKSLLDTPDY